MKINRCRSQVVRIPADEPLAGGSTSHRPYHHFVILRVDTEDGIEGLGVTFFGGVLSATLSTRSTSWAS